MNNIDYDPEMKEAGRQSSVLVWRYKMKKDTRTGWVLKTKVTGVYFASTGIFTRSTYTEDISEACIFVSRQKAREAKLAHEKEVKVRLTVEEV
jgi:hypothetical protein